MKNIGGSAFPYGEKIIEIDTYGDNRTETTYGMQEGMTLRDYFAAKAMQTLLEAAITSDVSVELRNKAVMLVATTAYQIADLMLIERSK